MVVGVDEGGSAMDRMRMVVGEWVSACLESGRS